mmetsp:Transcript_81490/g.181404  ORF Transcript_81490/g.181404 Transcript_81490/m.181404 type:complete len:101 (+) Transcript_81490:57-359(+)
MACRSLYERRPSTDSISDIVGADASNIAMAIVLVPHILVLRILQECAAQHGTSGRMDTLHLSLLPLAAWPLTLASVMVYYRVNGERPSSVVLSVRGLAAF